MTEDDEAWFDGFNAAGGEYEDAILGKDAFIAEQSLIIVEMMQVFDKAGVWDAVPADLFEKLRSYV